MGIYESISTYYDYIFPAYPETIRFLDKRSKPRGRILDIACGTGSHALGLTRLGHRVTGIDLNRAMIARAGEKCDNPDAEFLVGDMLRLKELFSDPECFDLVYCIGNSLVHLDNEEQIGRVLKDSFDLLAPMGQMVVQIINFDRILHDRVVELPPIRSEGKNLLFNRVYDYEPGAGKVLFKTELIVQEQGKEKRIEDSTPLRILMSSRLEELTARAGFRETALYGSFREESYSLQAFPTILSARKV